MIESRYLLLYRSRLSLGSFSLIHALVDAATVGLVLSFTELGAADLLNVVLLYNFLAFGSQFLLGLAVDRWRMPKTAAALGCLLALLAVPAASLDHYGAAVLAGLGNSLFHVGGGSVSLNIRPGKAAPPGIFVAPGALGLFTGVILGRSGAYAGWLFMLLLAASAMLIMIQQSPPIAYERQRFHSSAETVEVVVILLLLTVLVRALVGMTVSFPWKSDTFLATVLVGCIVLGKGGGGILADRFGWRRVAVTGLLLSAPLITFLGDTVALAVAGAFCFQMTMAVTLASVAALFPGRPAFAFGLPCLALITGALPAFTAHRTGVGSDWLLFIVILISALLLSSGLGMLSRLTMAGVRGGGVSLP